MNIQQIRNATVVVTYGGKKFIIDPWFQKKGTGLSAPAASAEKASLPSPMVELPMPVDEIMDDVDAIIVTHIHPDHFEEETAKMLNKDIPVFVCDESTKTKVESFGYRSVSVLLDNGLNFGSVELIRTEGMHGESRQRVAGEVCGVVFRSDKEKTLYIAGDTVYYDGVEKTIKAYQPEIIILNACGATLLSLGRLIMDAEDVRKVCIAAPNATVIASHMEAVNHATVTRADLRNYLNTNGLTKQVFIPADGEGYSL